jgi:ribosomal protein L11 methyltransferase
MNYIGIEIKSNQPENWNDIIIALLSEHPFESFEEKDDAVWAYIPESNFHENMLGNLAGIAGEADIKTTISVLEKVNWNKDWEKQFDPVEIEDICYIYAPFHDKPAPGKYKHTMCIMPKMAFGTGHHATTWLMIYAMENVLDFTGKSVLDMGCGTGVLALYARIKEAGNIHAIDIDDWAIENTIENFETNDSRPPEYAKCGDRNVIPNDARYDIILANINRNVLLEDLPIYTRHLENEGHILLSGFYPADIPVLEPIFRICSLIEKKRWERNGWCCLFLKKKS